MDLIANDGKHVEIEVHGDIFLRHAIHTRFITPSFVIWFAVHYFKCTIELFKQHYSENLMGKRQL